MIIEDYIQRHASATPDVVAVLYDDRQVTYAELWLLVSERASQFSQQGIRRGQPYLFRSSQTLDFLVTYFALHILGAVAVPLEHDLPEARYDELARSVEDVSLPETLADVLFTTGTTGKAKGVMISHRTILSNAENLVAAQGFHPGMRFILCGPLNHIGTLSKVYPTLLVGGTLCVTAGMKDINSFFRSIETSTVPVATFLVPSNIQILMQLDSNRLHSLSDKIEFIETGAAPISQETMSRLCQLLPQSRLFNTYASTETGIISTYDFNHHPCISGCLGQPMQHSDFAITDAGTIVCKGDTLMLGYLNDPELTRQVLHDDGLHTNDRGHIDADGQLHLDGRNDDIINIGGYKVNPMEVEEQLSRLPEVADCICISIQHPVLGRALKLLIKMQPDTHLDRKHIANFLRQHLDSYKVPQFYEQVDEIQRTYNGKLNRKFYQQAKR